MEFNQKLKQGDLPNSITHLTFGNNFNQPLDIDLIPRKIVNLTFGKKFLQRLDHIHLRKLKHLTISFYYENHPDYLPIGKYEITYV